MTQKIERFRVEKGRLVKKNFWKLSDVINERSLGYKHTPLPIQPECVIFSSRLIASSGADSDQKIMKPCEMNLTKFWHCGAAKAKAMAPALLDCIGNPLTTSWEDCHALSKWMVSVHHHTGVPGFPVWWALNKSRGQIVNISPFIEDSYARAAAPLC
jgi:hypothetical protein